MTFLPSKFPWTTLSSNFEHIFFSFRVLMVSFHRHSPAYIHIIVVFCSSVHNVSFSPGYLNLSSTLFFPFDYVRVGFFLVFSLFCGHLSFLHLRIYGIHQIWKIFSHLSSNFFPPPFPTSLLGTPSSICLALSHGSSRVCSVFFQSLMVDCFCFPLFFLLHFLICC